MDCNFTITDDNLVESTEEIAILATVTSGIANFAKNRDTAIVTIIDDDGRYYCAMCIASVRKI